MASVTPAPMAAAVAFAAFLALVGFQTGKDTVVVSPQYQTAVHTGNCYETESVLGSWPNSGFKSVAP